MNAEATLEGLRERNVAREPWWMRTGPRRALLVGLLLVSLLAPLFAKHNYDLVFIYLYCASTLFLSAWFCWKASLRYPAEKARWQMVVLALCIHGASYAITAIRDGNWISYSKAAWTANAFIAVSRVLFLPALMGVRAARGRWVRGLDYALALVASALMMWAMGSGKLPGEGMSRVMVVFLALIFVAGAAYVAKFASAQPGIKLFTSVMSMYLTACVAVYFLLNIVNLYWLPDTPLTDLMSDIVIAVPQLLLYNWVIRLAPQPRAKSLELDPALVDSLQPSLMAMGGVLLALYGFRTHAVLAGVSVVVLMLCYAVRTQLFYHALFGQQKQLRTRAGQMEELATRDALTSVGNRRWFDEEAEKLLAAGRSYPCSMVLVDTDKFKEINDSFGHPLGDEVLRAVALALSEVNAQVKRGLCARIGGDEFGALWPGTDAAEAMVLAEALRMKVEALVFEAPIGLTASLGVATTQDPLPLMKLLRWADSALYRAKAAGRNVVRGIDLGALREEPSPED